jgi:hypothetical protein
MSANQANAKLSTGPVTAEGKQRASMNAFRHGLRSKQVVLPGEDPAEYEALTAAFDQHHPAETPVAARAVREMIDSEWRLRRIRVVLDRTLTLLCEQYQNNTKDPAQLQSLAHQQLFLRHDNLLKYELKLERQFDRALRTYRLAQRESDAQDKSRAEQAAAMEDFNAKARTLVAQIKTQTTPDATDRSGINSSASASREAGVENPIAPTSKGTPNDVRGDEPAIAAPDPIVRSGVNDAQSQNATNEPNPNHIQRSTPRNAPCPCGSKLKHKRCCGKNVPVTLCRTAAA